MHQRSGVRISKCLCQWREPGLTRSGEGRGQRAQHSVRLIGLRLALRLRQAVTRTFNMSAIAGACARLRRRRCKRATDNSPRKIPAVGEPGRAGQRS